MRRGFLTVAAILLSTASLFAQLSKAMPEPPHGITLDANHGYGSGTVLDTTYNLPMAGKTWTPLTATEFTAALQGSQPGDVIILKAGTVYTGNFHAYAKPNSEKKWIYVISSELDKLPEHRRVSPEDAVHMPKIVSNNAVKQIEIDPGANHWRFAGIEFYSNSAYPAGCGGPGKPNCTGQQFIASNWKESWILGDNIFADRLYMHGDEYHEMQQAIQINFTNVAVIDSYISNIHMAGVEAQAVAGFNTTGPIKIVNNYLESATENFLLGGAGKNYNVGVPSDVEFRNNHLLKPLSWVPLSLPPISTHVVKNLFELKTGKRVLVDGNIMENNWYAGQTGYSIIFTVRSCQTGDFTVIEDVTFTNNLILNSIQGFNLLDKDDGCGIPPYEQCHSAGQLRRVFVGNNLMTMYDPNLPGGRRAPRQSISVPIKFERGIDRLDNNKQGTITDVVFQHNTFVPPPNDNCSYGPYFPNSEQPPVHPISDNLWMIDNVFCKQPNGQQGFSGTNGAYGLDWYMKYPTLPPNDDLHRFTGNVMQKANDNYAYRWPVGNIVTTSANPVAYVDPASGNYQLASPNWRKTTDGKIAGIDYAELMRHVSGVAPNLLRFKGGTGVLFGPRAAWPWSGSAKHALP